MRNKALFNILLTVSAVFLLVNTGKASDENATERTEDIRFYSEGVALGATLWLPDGDGPHPAMVTVHGSGRATRHNYASVARHFVKMGIAVLTYDKRGVGESGGQYVQNGNTSLKNLQLLSTDAAEAVAYLKKRKEIDKNQIGFWGVSQAGWIVPIAVSKVEDAKFTILISGPTVTTGEENYYSSLEGDGIRRSSGLSRQEISRLLQEKGPYGFDPVPYLQKMEIPGLWLLGDADKSIPIPETVAILETMIKEHKRDFVYKVFPDANHGLRVNGTKVKDYWQVQDEFLLKHVGLKIK